MDRYDLHSSVKLKKYAPVTNAKAITVLMFHQALDIPAIGKIRQLLRLSVYMLSRRRIFNLPQLPKCLFGPVNGVNREYIRSI